MQLEQGKDVHTEEKNYPADFSSIHNLLLL